jgi:hypothetical protein
MRRIFQYLLRKFADERIALLEDSVQVLRVYLNASEAEMRMYRIRLGWEMPGRYAEQGHWVWHSNDGAQRPFPGERWDHVLPPSVGRVKDYCD